MSRFWATPRQAFWVVAAIAGLGVVTSLGYSEVLGLRACDLCWYQRGLLYPLAPVALYAVYADAIGLWRLVLPVAIAGIGVAAYQSWLQLSTSGMCTVGGCSDVSIRVLGLTIPNQSLLGFVAIALAMGWVGVVQRRHA